MFDGNALYRASEYNQIPLLRPGLGSLFQSGTPEEWIRGVPGPLVVVSLQPQFHAAAWIDRIHLHGVIQVPFKDAGNDCLADALYLGTVGSIVAFLRQRVNVLTHCAAGISRSSYINAGVLMVVHGWEPWRALDHLRAYREGASPNDGFYTHLTELESRLQELHGGLEWEGEEPDTL